MKHIHAKMNWIPPIVMGSWGILLLHLYIHEKLFYLQHPRFHPFTLLSSILLLGLTFLYPFLPNHHECEKCGHSRHFSWRTLLLLLPLVLYLSYPDLKVNIPSERIEASQEVKLPATVIKSSWNPEKSDHPTLLELLIALDDPDVSGIIEGRKIRILGQYVPSESGLYYLSRLLMFCCAADAFPVSVLIQGDATQLSAGQWAEVAGTVQLPETQQTPVLIQESIRCVQAPKDIYLY